MILERFDGRMRVCPLCPVVDSLPVRLSQPAIHRLSVPGVTAKSGTGVPHPSPSAARISLVRLVLSHVKMLVVASPRNVRTRQYDGRSVSAGGETRESHDSVRVWRAGMVDCMCAASVVEPSGGDAGAAPRPVAYRRGGEAARVRDLVMVLPHWSVFRLSDIPASRAVAAKDVEPARSQRAQHRACGEGVLCARRPREGCPGVPAALQPVEGGDHLWEGRDRAARR